MLVSIKTVDRHTSNLRDKLPIHGRVVRHTETGGFAVAFEDVDFRTQILLRALLPRMKDEEERPHSNRVHVSPMGHVEAELPPALFDACCKLADSRGVHLEDWILEQLERAALEEAAFLDE